MGDPAAGVLGRALLLPLLYGQWAGEHHPEQVSVASLIQILATEVGDGVTELGCHPGCADSALVSSYTIERELGCPRCAMVACAVFSTTTKSLSSASARCRASYACRLNARRKWPASVRPSKGSASRRLVGQRMAGGALAAREDVLVGPLRHTAEALEAGRGCWS